MKNKVLLCWNYERQSWVNQFHEIFKNENYCYLNFFSKSQEKANFAEVKVYYWEDFKNIDHVLSLIDPAIVVFMGLDGPYTLLLNYVCKQNKIPTYFLQHGIFHSYNSYRHDEKMGEKIGRETKSDINVEIKSKASSPKISFLKNSITPERIPIFIKIFSFLVYKKYSNSLQKALKLIAGESVQADHYIVYTKFLSRIFVERDKVPDEKFIEIGNEEANQIINHIFEAGDPGESNSDYFLFIDEAFSGSAEYDLPPVVTAGKYNNFLSALADYALSKEKKLKVKLHPYSYSTNHFVTHKNIEYIRHADTTNLIANCSGVFGFTSTLLIPALFVKSACIFKLNNFSHIHDILEKMNYCKVLDFNTFKPDEIEMKARNASQTSDFIHYFLYKLDNNCMVRLKEILHSKLTNR